MESYLIELLTPIELNKDDRKPIYFEQGTIFKVLMETSNALIVSNDPDFNFTIQLSTENTVWRRL